jgi:hypothetical protein
MAEQDVTEKDSCIVCGGNAGNEKPVIGITRITEKPYRGTTFGLCKQCRRDPRIAAEKLASKIGELKASGASVEFLETFVVPTINELVAAHRIRINE